ncbi:MAG: EamA family transporter, partial [Alphaproteobacteria bacterium]|nr:EamA family transporter [Alphaproteobacteria bacterium]
ADVGPVAAGFWRLAIVAPLLLLIGWRSARGEPRTDRSLVLLILVGGLFFAADLAAWHVGIGMTKLANASLFANCSSFLLVLYGFIIVRRLPRPIQRVSLTSAALGTLLLLGSSYELSSRNFAGDLFALLAGLFYTFYLIAIDRARRVMRPMPVLALATIAGTAPLLLFAWLLGETLVPTQWLPLILLSLGSQLIGQGLLVYAVGNLSPVVVGIGLLIQPAAGSVIGWLAYGERLGLADVVGALMIAVALILIRVPEKQGP